MLVAVHVEVATEAQLNNVAKFFAQFRKSLSDHMLR